MTKYRIISLIFVLSIIFCQAASYYILNIRDNSIYKMAVLNPDGTVSAAPENKLTYRLIDFANSSTIISLSLGLLAVLFIALDYLNRHKKENIKNGT